MAQSAVDPRYGQPEPPIHRLTLTEIASILRVTPRTVYRLGERVIRIGREERYQQSALREYLRQQ